MLSSKLKRAYRAVDRRLASAAPAPPASGWMRAMREAIGMTGQQFANRLGVAWQSMDDLEKSEAAGTITLDSLRRGAAALECEFVYFIVPKAGTAEALVTQRARAVALRSLARSGQTMALEDQATQAGEREHLLDDYIQDHVRDRDLWAE